MNNVFDGSGNRLGYYSNVNAAQVYAYNQSGKVVGWYNKSSDTSFDRNGKRYGKGNLVESLIRAAAS